MMTTTGLILDAIGVILVFFATPEVRTSLVIYSRAERPVLEKKDNQKNLLHKGGLILLLAGFACQIVDQYL